MLGGVSICAKSLALVEVLLRWGKSLKYQVGEQQDK